MTSSISRLLLLLSGVFLAACATQAPAPVNDGTLTTQNTPSVNSTDNPYGATPYTPDTPSSATVTTPTVSEPSSHAPYVGNYAPVDVNATYHKVVAGDTVYNIAKRYGISQDDLRAWNQLADNNINLGQTLRVKPAHYSGSNQTHAAVGAASPVNSASGTHQVMVGDTVYNIAKRYGISQEQLRQANQLNDNNIKIGQILRIGSAAAVANAANKAVVTPSVPASAPVSTEPKITSTTTTTTTTVSKPMTAASVFQHDGLTWQAPLSGSKVIVPFGSGKNNIKLAGKVGEDIVAAADGQVIFVGHTPRGYSGNLVIIQHESGYVSAYSNNQSVAVREQQYVKRGQKLGTLDSEGNMLFEMRHGDDKKPIDPSKIITF